VFESITIRHPPCSGLSSQTHGSKREKEREREIKNKKHTYLRAMSPSTKRELAASEGLGLLLDPLLDGQG